MSKPFNPIADGKEVHYDTLSRLNLKTNMKVSQAEFQNMKEEIVKDLIARLMEEQGLTMQEAFEKVYASRLFEKLSDPKTGLYFQSSGYAYSYLEEELNS